MSNSSSVIKCQVLVIGAGPTGLMAANQLARFGVDVQVIDKKSGPAKESRALALQARSLEMYSTLGKSDEVLKQSGRATTIEICSFGNSIAQVPFLQIGLDGNTTPFPGVHALEQSKNEEILYDTFKEFGKDVLWNTGFEKLEKNEEHSGVLVLAKNQLTAESMRFEAAFLVAADGASSPVRHQLNIPFLGGTYDQLAYTADTEIEWKSESYDRFLANFGDATFVAFFPIDPVNRLYRLIGFLPKHLDQKLRKMQQQGIDITRQNDPNASLVLWEDVQESIYKQGLHHVNFPKPPNWFRVYRLHHRVAKTLQRNSAFLCGDAGHVHSPAGGQGMNTGIIDACNLAWKLAFHLKLGSPRSIVGTYNEERLPFAKWLINTTDRAFSTMASSNGCLAYLLKHFWMPLMGQIVQIQYVRETFFHTVSQIWVNYITSSLSETVIQLKGAPSRLGSYPGGIKGGNMKAGERFPYVQNVAVHMHLIGPHEGDGLKFFDNLWSALHNFNRLQVLVCLRSYFNRSDRNELMDCDGSKLKELRQSFTQSKRENGASNLVDIVTMREEDQANAYFFKVYGISTLASPATESIVIIIRPDMHIGFIGPLNANSVHTYLNGRFL